MSLKKIIPALLLLFALFSLGCLDFGEDYLFMGMEGRPVPQECSEYADDVCGLFSCTVELCGCYDAPGAVIKFNVAPVQSGEEAVAVVKMFFNANETEFMEEGMRAVEVNDFFYNVFAQTPEGDELTVTVAIDGTAMQTICGV